MASAAVPDAFAERHSASSRSSNLRRTRCKRNAAVITDLFVVASGIDPAAIARAVPPACRREPSPPPAVTASERELLLEFGEWRPRAASRHLLPSFSTSADVPYTLRFEVSVLSGAAWSPWIATVTMGPGEFAELAASDAALACDVDVYTAPVPVERVRLRVRLGAPDPRVLAAAPWMATLSASDLAPRIPGPRVTAPARIAVPALSQLDARPEIAMRICSPTSVAMVLARWGRPTSPAEVAEDVFHRGTDSYGLWPAAVRAAGRRGVAGYLLRFPDWPSAAWCLERQLPIVASVRYAAGELTGAALGETTGHLLVITGCDGADVLVNDPVAPTAEVARRYRLDEIERVWLDRAGVGYVLFRPEAIRGA
jgi:Peptidase_C39 like family